MDILASAQHHQPHLFVNGALPPHPALDGLPPRPHSSLDISASGAHFGDGSSPTRPTSANGIRLPTHPHLNGPVSSPHHAAAAAAAAQLFAAPHHPHFTPLHTHQHLGGPQHAHLGLAPTSSPMMTRTHSSPAAVGGHHDALFASLYHPGLPVPNHANSPAAVAAAAAAAAAAAHAAVASSSDSSSPAMPRAASYATVAPPHPQPSTPGGAFAAGAFSPHPDAGYWSPIPPPMVSVTASPFPTPPLPDSVPLSDDAFPPPSEFVDPAAGGGRADRGPLMPVYFRNDDGGGVGIMMSAKTLEQLEQQREEAVYECEFCDKVYTGKHARSIWRRHLSDKHQIPLSSQPRRTRWDNGQFFHPQSSEARADGGWSVDANRPKSEAERRERTLESKRRWARKNRAEKRAIREAGLAVPKTARDISATAASLGFTAESAAKARAGKAQHQRKTESPGHSPGPHDMVGVQPTMMRSVSAQCRSLDALVLVKAEHDLQRCRRCLKCTGPSVPRSSRASDRRARRPSRAHPSGSSPTSTCHQPSAAPRP